MIHLNGNHASDVIDGTDARVNNLFAKAVETAGNFGLTGKPIQHSFDDLLIQPEIDAAWHTLRLFLVSLWTSEEGIFLHLIDNQWLAPGVKTPWSGTGKLGRVARFTLRNYILWQQESRQTPPLFYNSHRRDWALDTVSFESLEDVELWLKNNKPTERKWMQLRRQVSIRLSKYNRRDSTSQS